MRLPHRLQGQKVKSQGHGTGAYCGGHLAAQLVWDDSGGDTLSYVRGLWRRYFSTGSWNGIFLHTSGEKEHPYTGDVYPTFLPRDAMHKRGLCRRHVVQWLYGWVSVTFVYCVETEKDTDVVATIADRKPY